MGGRKTVTNHTRSIGKTGNADSPSYFLTIPIEIVRSMGWVEGEKVRVKKSRGKVVIETIEQSLETNFDRD